MEQDKKHSEAIDAFTEELVGELAKSTKALDQAFKQAGGGAHLRDLEYCEREDDEELKAMYEKERKRVERLTEEMGDRIDGEINMDLHGNITFKEPESKKAQEPAKEGITEAGTYILRDGKLVRGKAELREQAQFSNWYCSNADPEDIRRHRELMDRMHYRGPQWDGIGVPKSVIEEENPVYKPRDPEEHPSIAAPEEEGEKAFEHVVR